jgi:hypothetical protein
MTSPSTGRPWWSRRDFLKNATAVAAGAYGLSPAFALAAPVPEKIRRGGIQAQGAGAERQIRRRAVAPRMKMVPAW